MCAGVVLPLLAQTIVLWQVLLAVTILKKRLVFAQGAGVVMVVAGVALAAWPGSSSSAIAGAPSRLPACVSMLVCIVTKRCLVCADGWGLKPFSC